LLQDFADLGCSRAALRVVLGLSDDALAGVQPGASGSSR